MKILKKFDLSTVDLLKIYKEHSLLQYAVLTKAEDRIHSRAQRISRGSSIPIELFSPALKLNPILVVK